jgi:hypothetical protein
MNKNKNTINTTSNTPLVNDCTSHLAFHLKQFRGENKPQPKTVNSSYETPLDDVVTYEYIRGYN